MNKDQELTTNYVEGVKEAVSNLEKNASFQAWMQNERFREKYSQRIVDLVTKVRGDSTEE